MVLGHAAFRLVQWWRPWTETDGERAKRIRGDLRLAGMLVGFVVIIFLGAWVRRGVVEILGAERWVDWFFAALQVVAGIGLLHQGAKRSQLEVRDFEEGRRGPRTPTRAETALFVIVLWAGGAVVSR